MILVTGGAGFIGRALVERLASDGLAVRAAVRTELAPARPGAEIFKIGEIGAGAGWGACLAGITEVVHCAALTNMSGAGARDGLSALRDINVHGALNLARQAASAGVRRFVFLSSIRVNGDATPAGRPFTADDAPDPQDGYARTKMEAEGGLREIADASGMELVIVRPPLVYGPAMKSALGAAAKWMVRGLPLPLGAVSSPRSLVALENLVDLLATSVSHPAAAHRTLLVSDDEDLSITDFLRRLAITMNKPARLLPVSPSILLLAASAMGAGNSAQRLCASLQVDISETKRLLNWAPPTSVEAAMKAFAEGSGKGGWSK